MLLVMAVCWHLLSSVLLLLLQQRLQLLLLQLLPVIAKTLWLLPLVKGLHLQVGLVS